MFTYLVAEAAASKIELRVYSVINPRFFTRVRMTSFIFAIHCKVFGGLCQAADYCLTL